MHRALALPVALLLSYVLRRWDLHPQPTGLLKYPRTAAAEFLGSPGLDLHQEREAIPFLSSLFYPRPSQVSSGLDTRVRRCLLGEFLAEAVGAAPTTPGLCRMDDLANRCGHLSIRVASNYHSGCAGRFVSIG